MAVQVEQVLCPLHLVTRLESPGPIDVARVIDVVVPVYVPLLVVVLPHEASSLGCEHNRERVRQRLGAREVRAVVRRLVRCDEHLAHMHVRVLTTVRVDGPIGGDRVEIGSLLVA